MEQVCFHDLAKWLVKLLFLYAVLWFKPEMLNYFMGSNHFHGLLLNAVGKSVIRKYIQIVFVLPLCLPHAMELQMNYSHKWI